MISKLRLLLILGIVTLFLPYYGLPRSWKNILTIAIGVVLIYLSFALKRVYKVLKYKLRRVDEVVRTEPIIHS